MGLLVVTTGLVLRAGNVLVLVIILGMLPAVLALLGPGIFEAVFGDLELYYGGDQLSARSRLTAGGAQIATEHFPLGVGFGRYASATAADYYSPEYTKLGFENIYGVGSGPEMGKYLNDTQWPALLGETGWLGTIAFVVGAVLAAADPAAPGRPDEPAIVRWIRLSGICWFTLIMLDSVAAPAFTSPPVISVPVRRIGDRGIDPHRRAHRLAQLRSPRARASTAPGRSGSPLRPHVGLSFPAARCKTPFRLTPSERTPELQTKETP